MTAVVDVKQHMIDAPPSSITSNPQQGMFDPRFLAAGSADPTTPAACSPLTISSALEQQQQQATAAPVVSADGIPGVPVAVVGGPFMDTSPPDPPSTTASPSPNAEDKRWKRTPPTEFDSRKLFVGGLPSNVNDEQFLCFFEQFGQVIDSVVMVDRNTKRSRGFGFVTFASQEVTNSLLNKIPGKTGVIIIFGKSCEIKASEPKIDDGRYDSFSPRRYSNYGNNNNSSGRKMQPFHRAVMPNQYNRDNGYNGDERDFDDVQNRHFANNQSYYSHVYQNQPNMMMYHHPYGYPQYQHAVQNYHSNYSTEEVSNYEGGDVGGAGGVQYNNYHASSGYYPNQQHFVGRFGGYQGFPPQMQAQQQQPAIYGGYYSQGAPMYQGQFNDAESRGSLDSTSYEAQVYPATMSGVDGDYDQAAAGDT